MAQCVQPRCNERRRFMRRQLHSWAPTMLYVLGVERVAEQLMGRRQWRGCYSGSPRLHHDDDLNNTNNNNNNNNNIINNININNNNNHNAREVTELSHLLPGSHPTDWRPADKCSFCLSDAVTTSPSIDEDTARASCSPQSPSSSNTTSAPQASSTTSATTTTSTTANPPGQAELTAAVLRLATPEAVDIRETESPESSRESGRHCGSNGSRVAGVDVASGLGGGASSPGNRSSSSPELPPAAVSAMSAVAAATAAALRGVVPQTSPATMAAAAAAAAAAAVSAPYTWCLEQPLDLSAKPPQDHGALRNVPLDNRHIFRAKPRVSAITGGRRSYTEDELQAALRDIQSGKLGTRRAAVIYGIPRSTLRNKVYKLERERERDIPITTAVSGPNVADDDESGAEDERLVERELQKPLLSMEDIMRLACERGGGINCSSGITPGSNELPCLPGLDKAGLAPYITQLLAGAAEAAVAAVAAGATPPTSAPTTPSSATTPPNANNVILKIPSFKPSNCATSTAATTPGESNSASAEPSNSASNEVSSHHSASSSPVPAAAFKDAFTKGMAAKLVSAVGVNPNLNVTPPGSSMSLSSLNINNDKKSCSASGKGTRPKRGKYRNYDRDSLVEAVRAVQRGEMSVHRAGSYYGVPHSTLEYKVKERHLMRPRKREPKTNPSLVGSATTSSHDKPSSVGPTPPNKPGLPVPPAFQNGLKLSSGIFDTASLAPMLATPFFWRGAPTGFAPSSVATGSTVPPSVTAPPTMPKTTRQMAESLYDGTSANGSFLDGIIRSSLDNGISSSATSNRALLDQLCRSGHFGPGVPGSAPVLAAAPATASVPVSEEATSSDDENSSSAVAPTSQPETSEVKPIKPDAASQQ